MASRWRRRLSSGSSSYYAGRGLGAGLFPPAALSLADIVRLALALGIVGPFLGAVLAVAAPDSTGRRVEAIE